MALDGRKPDLDAVDAFVDPIDLGPDMVQVLDTKLVISSVMR
jgi:hypothetical protein